MQHPHVLRTAVCTACLVMGGAAFAQGTNSAHARVTPVVLHGAAGAGGIGSGVHGSLGTGGVRGNFAAGGVRNNFVRGTHGTFTAGRMHGIHGHHWAHGYGGYGGYGWGGDYAYGYPYDYGWDYDYPDYAYDYGYPYDSYAEGAYCQTPETSCALDHPAAPGEPCQCPNGIDEVPGTAQP